jgi:glycosyltransferase involved in cell wall biosynthesis
MRILHVNDNAGFFGGVEQIVHDIANGLGKRGWHQGVLFIEGGSESNYMGPFSWSGMCPEEALNRFNPDVVLFHKVSSANVVKTLSAQVPGVYMVHDHDIVCPRRHKYFPLNGQICDKPAGVNCVSNLCFVERPANDQLIPVKLFDGIKRQREDLRATSNIRQFITGSRWMASELAMNGIADELIQIVSPVPKSIGKVNLISSTSGSELLYVGQLIRGKGVDLMLKAVATMSDDWHLTIVGTGRQESEFKALASELNIAQKVHFAGWVDHDQLNNYYARSQLVVVPSRWPEPFGMVGIEAMARGRPVVGFASGGITDWLIHGQNGLLAKPGCTDDLAKKINLLMKDTELSQKLGKQARQHVLKNYTHEKFLGEMTDILMEAAA